MCCQQDERRDGVRHLKGWNGLDYVEVSDNQDTLFVYFLGKLPPELQRKRPGLARHLRLEGGQRVTGIRIIDVDPITDTDPEKDDYLEVLLDKSGDFSTYTLRLVDVEHIDPRHDHVEFSFKLDCPSDLDCAPACACEPAVLAEPEINYLAKDYASFRQLLLDRLALLVPEWKERHVPDLGIALVELLAYTGDYLSYYQDAVATEAYLDTARKRISVRRHARLVDYALHEGCNARAWVCLTVDGNLSLDAFDTSFITGLDVAVAPAPAVLMWEDLREVPARAYEVFEPLVEDRTVVIPLRIAHNEMHFYTWGDSECCLEKGSTSATLLDRERALQLRVGDVLIFEEVLGPRTGFPADADPARRHAVRLTGVSPGEDPVLRNEDRRPIPYVQISWAPEDALPFTLCLSAIGPAPECRYLEHISVARGNVILVDHGRTQPPEYLGPVPTRGTEAICECVEQPGEIQVITGRFEPWLKKAPITFRQPLPREKAGSAQPTPAASLLKQEVRRALPQVALSSRPARPWEPRDTLIESHAEDWQFVVEIDDDGVAHLRFGDGELGALPPAGMHVTAGYRVGNGSAGNVGPEAISRLVLKATRLNDVSVTVRNPLPARGGTDPEPVAEAKLFAPHLFRKELERAITAADYEAIAERNPGVQNASAELQWTGSWYEADVAIDPFGREDAPSKLVERLERYLERFRRMGHDLSVETARYVPLDLKLEVCALPHYQPGQVKAALLDRFSTRNLPGGKRGFFHPDNLTFGEGIMLSRIIAAAQAVPGVECVTVARFHRLFEEPNHELANGILPLRTWEIAQLDNAANFPEHGKLEIQVRGGR